MVTSGKCKCNNQHKAWPATNPPRKAKFKPTPIDGETNTQQGVTVATESSEADVVVIDHDTPEAQAQRNAQERNLMDSLPLDDDDDGNDMEFFDAMECIYDDEDNDKEN